MSWVGTTQRREQMLKVTVESGRVTVDVSDDLGYRTCTLDNRDARGLGTLLRERGGSVFFAIGQDRALHLCWLPEEGIVVWLFYTAGVRGHQPLFLYRMSAAEAKAMGVMILAELEP